MRLFAIPLLVVLSLTVRSALALDITNTSGRVFRDAKVEEVRPDGLKVFHSTGVDLISFLELPEAMQAEYGYDPEKEKVFQKQQAEQAAIQAKQARDKKIVDTIAASGLNAVLEIIQITDNGALVKGYWTTEEKYEETEYRTLTKAVGLARPDKDAPTRSERIAVKTENKTRVNTHAFPDRIFVFGVPSHLVDGNSFRAVIYPCGRHQYKTVTGAQATVEGYTTKISDIKRLEY